MMEQEGKSMETIQRYEPEGYKDRLGFYTPGSCVKYVAGTYVRYADHIAALAAKDAAIAALKGAVHADVKEFSRDSAALEAQAEQIRVLQSVLSLASDALEEAEAILGGEYGDFHAHLCENMIELKDRIAALASTAPVAEAGQDFQDALTHIDMLTELVGDLAQEINYVRDLGGKEFLSSSYPGSLKRADEFLNSIAREDRGGSK